MMRSRTRRNPDRRVAVRVTVPVDYPLAPHGPGRLGVWAGNHPWPPGTTEAELSESRVREIEYEIAHCRLPLSLVHIVTGESMSSTNIRVRVSTIPPEAASAYALGFDGVRYLFLGTTGDDGLPNVLPAGGEYEMSVPPSELDAMLDAIRGGNTNYSLRRLS